MSQNINNQNYNNDPYEFNPNPINPNYAPDAGIAYGSSSVQPPSGPNPASYTPNSTYGPYDNSGLYAPPPPGQNPYADSTQPAVGFNPYDPDAQTVTSQQRRDNPAYPLYPAAGPFVQPPLSQLSQRPQKKSRVGFIIALVIVVILVIGGSVFGLLAYNRHQNTVYNNATTTALAWSQSTAQANAQLTATAQATATAQTYATATATAIASTYPFSNNLALTDPLTDNSKGLGWDSDGKYCFFSGSAYHVFDDAVNTYQPCLAVNTNFSNFTFQVDMIINQGNNNTSAGLIFRASKALNKLYRFAISDQGVCSILVSVDNTTTHDLQDCQASQFHVGFGMTNIIAVVANHNKISIYVNQVKVTDLNDSTLSAGQIGFEAENIDATCEAIFSNAKVWRLSA
jgi:hypothetical protein